MTGRPTLASLDVRRLMRGPQSGRSLLVLSYDGFILHASIVSGTPDRLTLDATTSTRNPAPDQALDTALGALATAGHKLPGTVLLLHVSAVTNVIAPPIADGTDLTPGQTAEMVRWEMEGLYSDVAPTWDIGWVLIGMGYLTEAQREEVLDLMASARAESTDYRHGGRPTARFGEIAVDAGFINQGQLEECLHLQEALQLGDGGIRVGWAALATSPPRWLSTAVDGGTHGQWLSAIEAAGTRLRRSLRLEGIFSIPGAACGLLQLAPDANECVLEIHDAYVSVALVTGAGLTRIATLKSSSRQVHAAEIAAALRDIAKVGCDRILVLKDATSADDTLADLREAMPGYTFVPFTDLLGRENGPLVAVSGSGITPALISQLGAARAWLAPLPQLASRVEGMPPPPPFYRRREGQMAIAVLVALAIPLGTEAYHAWSQARLRDQLLQLEARRADLRTLERASAEAQSLSEEQQRLQADLDQLLALKSLVQTALQERQDFIPAFLPMIANTANSGIVLNSIEEPSWNLFRITGYARDQRAADAYYTDLSRQLERWDMTVLESPTSLKVDAAGIPRYEFSFLLGKRGIAPANATTSATAPVRRRN